MKNSLCCMLWMMVFVGVPCLGYELNWSPPYPASNAESGAFSLNCSPNGKFFVIYVDPDAKTVESYINDRNTITRATVADIESAPYAKNAVDFGVGIPVSIYYDFYHDHIMTAYYLSDWSTPQQIPDSNGARYVKLDMHGGNYYVAFCYDDPGSNNCYLKYMENTTGTWVIETVARISRTSINHHFDMKVDSTGTPHLVWWDHYTLEMIHATRTGPDTYTTELLYDDPVGCAWIELEFLTPDLPIVGFLDNSGTTKTVRMAYKVGSSWYDLEIYDDNTIGAIDMGLNNEGYLTTNDLFFVLSQSDGYYTLTPEGSGWGRQEITSLSTHSVATAIRADWDIANGALGIVTHNSNTNLLYFLRGTPITPTPTPTRTPTATPTTGPGTPTVTPTPDCTVLGVQISMPSAMYHEGDICYCDVIVCNPGATTYNGTPLLVVLDVYGQFFFGPSFTSDYDQYTINVLPGSQTIEILPAFSWPSGAGSASDIWFYAGMTDPAVTELLGEYDAFSFGWE